MTDAAPRLDAALAAATAALAEGSDSPALDAQVLLAHCLGRPRSYLLAFPERRLDADTTHRFDTLVARRARGEPVAHLTGEREFWSLPFEVSPATLIPRPETEHLVACVLERLAAHARVLDLGTGSGAIAIAIAHERPDVRVDAVEASVEALAVARRNGERLAPGRVRFMAGDWYEPVATETYDAVVANPPYIGCDEPEPAQGDARFEPRQALLADDQGLAAINRIIDGAAPRLVPGGLLALEHGWRQGGAVRERLAGRGFARIATCPDLQGHDRVTLGYAPCEAPGPTDTDARE